MYVEGPRRNVNRNTKHKGLRKILHLLLHENFTLQQGFKPGV